MQKCGILSSLEFTDFNSDERGIVHNLATSWFVSFAKVHEFKSTRYPYVFLKPTTELSDRFNLHSEVLCVFNCYDHFDARSLDFVDKTLSDFANRLDKLCVLIISKASGIYSDIERITQDKESRIFIPFHFSDLEGGATGKNATIIHGLEKGLYTKDLFAFDSPLRSDRYFFGRKADVQALVGKFQNGENGSVFGLRRIGKTSVLLAVERQLRLRKAPVVFIDCSDTRFHIAKWNETLYQIKESLYKANTQSIKSGHQLADYTELKASICFQDDLEKLKRIFKSPVLLILDEIESLTFGVSASAHWANGTDYLFFWQTIRSVFQQNPGLFSFIISGVNPVALETPKVAQADNPIYRFITPEYLGFFDVDEVELMVSYIGKYMGMSFAREIYTYLTDEFGGHPFLIRQACSQLHKFIQSEGKMRPFFVSKEYFQARKESVIRNIQEYIELILHILREKYNDEYVLLTYLAHDDYVTFTSFARESNDWTKHLVGYGLISSSPSLPNQYHFRIGAVRTTILEKENRRPLPNSAEARWKSISEERNRFEKRFRSVARLLLKTSLGETKAKAAIIDVMNKQTQKIKANNAKYDDIFSDNKENELYFLDLKKVVEANWHIFSNIFKGDKAKFSTFMDIVNKQRGDAHANTISEDDFTLAKSSLDWLWGCLETNC